MAIVKWPAAITAPPITSERRVPMNRSARYPPMSGVRYTSIMYVPYRFVARGVSHSSTLTRYSTRSARIP
jgi:hypothetical protein